MAKGGSYKLAISGGADYVSIDRKWLYDLLELSRKQSNGKSSSGIRRRVKNPNRILPRRDRGRRYKPRRNSGMVVGAE